VSLATSPGRSPASPRPPTPRCHLRSPQPPPGCPVVPLGLVLGQRFRTTSHTTVPIVDSLAVPTRDRRSATALPTLNASGLVIAAFGSRSAPKSALVAAVDRGSASKRRDGGDGCHDCRHRREPPGALGGHGDRTCGQFDERRRLHGSACASARPLPSTTAPVHTGRSPVSRSPEPPPTGTP
jgi:hypothetical protein